MENVFSVSKKQWKKWNHLERYIFNSIYDQMMTSPDLFNHPKQTIILEHWGTVAWNAAWIAADDIRIYRKNYSG